MVLARNEGRDYLGEGPPIFADAAKSCTPLREALDIWKDVTFDYASTDSNSTMSPRLRSRLTTPD